MIDAVFVFPVIREEYIFNALSSLYRNTDCNFRVIVIDQTVRGIYDSNERGRTEIKGFVDLYLRPKRNLGFAKAMNEGIIHGLHWGAKYIVACNDDVEFIDKRWWYGMEEFFEEQPEMIAANPASIIEPGWGYGYNTPNFKCPDWGIEREGNIFPKKLDGGAFTYEDAHSEGGYDWLLNHYKKGWIEGFAGWCIVGKRQLWEEVSLYDERFVPGGGEDYDLTHRIYESGYRCASTMKSWVWHWWGKSREIVNTSSSVLPTQRKTFQDVNSLFELHEQGVTSPIFPPDKNKQFGGKQKRKNKGVFVDDIRG